MLLKMLSPPPPPLPHPPSSSLAIASPASRGEFVMFPLARLPRKHQDSGQGGKSTDSSLSLFNLTRQAALGTFQSIFKLTIYNQFSKGDREGVEESSQPCVVMEGLELGVGG